MKTSSAMIAITLLAVSPCGCASLMHGTTQNVRFQSIPDGAMAHVGAQTTTTPGELRLDRNKTYDVEVEKVGYLPAHGHIGQETSGAIWGNILIGGLIGILIDSADGAAYNLVPDTITITLVPDPALSDPSDSTTAPEPVPINSQ